MEERERGGATIEQVGLTLLIGLAMLGLIAAVAKHGPIGEGRELGAVIGQRMSCAPIASDPCRRDRLTVAYGESLARLIRSLAPSPPELRASDGLVAVDFRYCRRPSCAVPVPGARGERLTTSNRRITAYTQVRDNRRRDGTVQITYWLYRPGHRWQPLVRQAGTAELTAARSTPLGRDETPILVPLETLPGRNHYRFTRLEEPPWRWQVTPIFPGRPS